MSRSAYLYLFVLSVVAAAAGIYVSTKVEGVLFWLILAVSLLSAVYALARVACRCVGQRARPRTTRTFQNVALSLGSLMLVAVCLEMLLGLQEQLASWSAAQAPKVRPDYPLLIPDTLSPEAFDRIWERRSVIALPDEWKKQTLSIEGARWSYRWHDAVHVYDPDYFRRTMPFPPKQANTLRLLILGDSLTYGYGIEQPFTYSEVIQKHLGRDYRIEVINLGVNGNQSEDILDVLHRYMPVLQPDLVFYGVCLNDFLPSEVGVYTSTNYAIPIPDVVKRYLEQRARLARFLADVYDKSLISLDLRPDFMDDVLKDFQGYQTRFAQDVANMARFAQQRHVPILAMVLDQFPELEGRSHRAAKIAERYLRDAGFNVIDTQNYYQAYDGRKDLIVSQWEGHPNELANALFASLIIPELRVHPALQEYQRRSRSTSTVETENR